MKIPVYEQQVRDSTALPGYQQNLRVTPDDYGAGLGEGIQRAAVGVGDAVRKYRAEQDTVVQQDAWSQLSEHGRQLLDDPTNGFKRQVGKDAMANRESVVTDFDAKVKQLSGGMSGDAQRVFLQNAGRLRSNFMDEVDDHTAKQIAVNDEQVHQATVSGAGNNITAVGLSFDDPALASKAMALGLNSALHAVETKGARLGWTREVIDAEKKKTATELYASTIDAMLEAGQAGKAKVALGDFVASGMADAGILAQKNTQKVVDAAALGDDAQALAQRAMAESKGDPVAADAVIDKAAEKNPDLLFAAKKLRDKMSADNAQAERQKDVPLLGVIDQGIYNPRGITFDPATSSEFQKLSDEGKATALRSLAAERRSLRSASNEERRIQSDADRNAAADFEKLANNDVNAAIELDTRTRYADASLRQRNLIDAKRGDLKKHQGVDLEGVLGQAKEAASRLTLPDKDGFISFIRDQYIDYANDPKNADHKKPPAEKVQGWIGDALLNGEETGGFFYNTNMRAYEAARAGKGFQSGGFEDENTADARKIEGQVAPAIKPPAATGNATQNVRTPDGKVWPVAADKVAQALARVPGSVVVQ